MNECSTVHSATIIKQWTVRSWRFHHHSKQDMLSSLFYQINRLCFLHLALLTAKAQIKSHLEQWLPPLSMMVWFRVEICRLSHFVCSVSGISLNEPTIVVKTSLHTTDHHATPMHSMAAECKVTTPLLKILTCGGDPLPFDLAPFWISNESFQQVRVQILKQFNPTENKKSQLKTVSMVCVMGSWFCHAMLCSSEWQLLLREWHTAATPSIAFQWGLIADFSLARHPVHSWLLLRHCKWARSPCT